MLNKLLKYEIKSSSRIFVPLYVSLIIFAIINNIFFKINSSVKIRFVSIITGISTLTYVFLIIATFIFTLVIMIQRFYKNLLGEEGHLMFTLPVKVNRHIFSKLIVSMMWVVSSIFVTLLSIFIISYGKGSFQTLFAAINRGIEGIHLALGINGYVFILEIFVIALIMLATSILMIYASIATGQLFSQRKLLGAFGAYLGFYIITQMVIGSIIGIGYSINQEYWVNFAVKVEGGGVLQLLFMGVVLIDVIFGGTYYLLTERILSGRLNLE